MGNDSDYEADDDSSHSQSCPHWLLRLSLATFAKRSNFSDILFPFLGPVVQSIISLTSSLRDQLVKCFTTLLPNKLIFLLKKMRKAFALQKLFTVFQPKILAFIRY